MTAPASHPRPNIRSIAAQAGVSSATVSLALRQHPRISAATRRRVLRIADALGYRPDPHVAKLMLHLRTRRPPGFQSTLAALTTIAAGRELPYLRDIVASARQRAEALGYGLTLVRLEDPPGPRRDVERMLRSRGVDGLLLLPLASPRPLTPLLDWKKFAVVTATNGVLAPEFHRVVPHQFSNMLALCQQLTRRGYRRLGMVVPAEHDLVVNHGFSAAVVWQNMIGGSEPVMPLLYEGEQPRELRRWFEAERPDVIITQGEADARAFAAELALKIPGRIGFAVANRTAGSLLAGIEERPSEIGAAAIRLLASLVQHGEKGVPAVPTVTMVKGEWVEGRSVRAEPRRRDAGAGYSAPRSFSSK
jgi:DNA-binding LacI/PurR family transcriptional regulator